MALFNHHTHFGGGRMIGRIWHGLSRKMAERRQMQLIESLPSDTLKDIGYPVAIEPIDRMPTTIDRRFY